MAHYLMLGKYTDKAMESISESGDRIKKFKELCQEHGGKVISHYLLMGKYDVACFIDAPNAETMAKIALVVGNRGFVRTQTFCAFTEQEQMEMVKTFAK